MLVSSPDIHFHRRSISRALALSSYNKHNTILAYLYSSFALRHNLALAIRTLNLTSSGPISARFLFFKKHPKPHYLSSILGDMTSSISSTSSITGVEYNLVGEDIDHIEDIDEYHPGGYHPTLIGDRLDDGRYTIARKLGYGGFSTVWLARDILENKFVSIKICQALFGSDEFCDREMQTIRKIETSYPSHPGQTHLLKPLRLFKHHGPNGIHNCIVTDVMSHKFEDYFRYPIWLVKEMTRQILLAIDLLHKSGVIHADLRLGNILFDFEDANWKGRELEELEKRFPEHNRILVERQDGQPLGPGVPEYLISIPITPIPLGVDMSIDEDTTKKVLFKLIDFGVAFLKSDSVGSFGTPRTLQAPEQVYEFADPELSEKIDIWTLGASLFEALLSYSIFPYVYEPLLVDTEEEKLLQILCCFSMRLGPIPMDVVNKLPDTMTRLIGTDGRILVEQLQNELKFSYEGESLEDVVTSLLGVRDETGMDPNDKRPDRLEADELGDFIDFLRKMLSWRAADRPSAATLLAHKWLTH